MRWRNTGRALFVGHRRAGGDPNVVQVGLPVRLQPGDEGEFPITPSVRLAVQAGVLAPVDGEARAAMKGD